MKSLLLSCLLLLRLLGATPAPQGGAFEADGVADGKARVRVAIGHDAQGTSRPGCDEHTDTCSVAVQADAEKSQEAPGSGSRASAGTQQECHNTCDAPASSRQPSNPAADNASNANASDLVQQHGAVNAGEVAAETQASRIVGASGTPHAGTLPSTLPSLPDAPAFLESADPATLTLEAGAMGEQLQEHSTLQDADSEAGASADATLASGAAAQAERVSKRVPTVIPGLEEFTLHDATPQPSVRDLGVAAAQLAEAAAAAAGAGWPVGTVVSGDDGGSLPAATTLPLAGAEQQEMALPAAGPVLAAAGAAGEIAPGASQLPDEDDLEEGRRINLADADAGASVIAVNKEAKYPDQAIDSDEDSYMKNFCASSKWLLLELSQLGRVDQVVLTMKEMYSSRVREFSVKGRQSHPKRDGLADYTRGFASDAWQLIGNFTAANVKGTQTFTAPTRLRVRYVLFQFLTHYGNEEVCALNRLQVLGMSAAQELEAALARQLGGPEPAPQPRAVPAAAHTHQTALSQGPPTHSTTAQHAEDGQVSRPLGTAGVADDRTALLDASSSISGAASNGTARPSPDNVAALSDTNSSNTVQGCDDEAEAPADDALLEDLLEAPQQLLPSHSSLDARLATTHALTKLLPAKLLARMGLTLQGELCRDSNNCQHGFSIASAVPSSAAAKVEGVGQEQVGAPMLQPPSSSSGAVTACSDGAACAAADQQVAAPADTPGRYAPENSPAESSAVDAPEGVANNATSTAEEGTDEGARHGAWQQPTSKPGRADAEMQAGASDSPAPPAAGTPHPQPQAAPVVPLPAMLSTPVATAARDLENLILALGSGSSNRHRSAGSLFDIFKQEFMMLKLNQTRMAKYMSQVVELLNKNTADMLGEVQDLEERLAAAKSKAEQAQLKATEAAATLVAAAEEHWAGRLAALEQVLSGKLDGLVAELQAARLREAMLAGFCTLLLLLQLLLAWRASAAAPAAAAATAHFVLSGGPIKPAASSAGAPTVSAETQVSAGESRAVSSSSQSTCGLAPISRKGRPHSKEAQPRASHDGKRGTGSPPVLAGKGGPLGAAAPRRPLTTLGLSLGLIVLVGTLAALLLSTDTNIVSV